jgi:hypothetical protein
LLVGLDCTSAQGFLDASVLPQEAMEGVLDTGLSRGGDLKADAVA